MFAAYTAAASQVIRSRLSNLDSVQRLRCSQPPESPVKHHQTSSNRFLPALAILSGRAGIPTAYNDAEGFLWLSALKQQTLSGPGGPLSL